MCPSQAITCLRLLLVGCRDEWLENQINHELAWSPPVLTLPAQCRI